MQMHSAVLTNSTSTRALASEVIDLIITELERIKGNSTSVTIQVDGTRTGSYYGVTIKRLTTGPNPHAFSIRRTADGSAMDVFYGSYGPYQIYGTKLSDAYMSNAYYLNSTTGSYECIVNYVTTNRGIYVTNITSLDGKQNVGIGLGVWVFIDDAVLQPFLTCRWDAIEFHTLTETTINRINVDINAMDNGTVLIAPVGSGCVMSDSLYMYEPCLGVTVPVFSNISVNGNTYITLKGKYMEKE